ncbi:MAG: transketolase [Clostridium sp.]|nr:transketolase [Clostridium sp.]MDD7283178.1 transketolase [Clostridium sp.]
MSSAIDTKSVNSIRVLAADAIQKANSGHPGLPLGSAPMAYELWANHMNHNPKNPKWENRDRFILSGGHGSALLYSLLHFFGYGITIEDMKNFRQLGSKTPGHPEYGHTVGVEATTGPLGAGMAMAVGMAMAENHLAATFNKKDFPVVDHYTYVLGGDGCMMEGISYEAFSLAGTLGLEKLIVLYDSNNISIEGDTNIAFRENVRKRFESFGFHTQLVEDGNDLDAIGKAIEAAKAEKGRPSMIEIKTKIGAGCPAKEGKASAHGEPLGVENVAALRANLGIADNGPFVLDQDVYDHFAKLAEEKAAAEDAWNALFADYCKTYPEMKELWDTYHNTDNAKCLYDLDEFWNSFDKPEATRNVSGKLLNIINNVVPNMFGGAADLAPSTKTNMKDAGDYSKENPLGKNIHFGIREIAMAAIGNGIALHGGLRPFVSTFFVFSDYVKPMARLSALMGVPLTYVLTHDSIGVGEDGPTHEPIEQLAMLRAMPNFYVYRPADATECAAAWYFAANKKDAPTALVLSRQNLPQLDGSSQEALKGGYILEDSAKDTPDAIIIATGSEVSLAVEAKKELAAENIDVRVVSMPCMDLFEDQPDEYKDAVLPKNVTARVGVEALSEFGWGRYIGINGQFVGMKSFGASAPGSQLFEHFGITKDAVVAAVKKTLN